MKIATLFLLCCSLISSAVSQGNCPRRGREPLEEGRKCKKRVCRSKADCRAKNKGCYCDSECGMSCFNKNFTCGEPGNIANGRVSRTSLGLGGEARYRCNEGYTLKGRSTRKCNADKKWGGNEPTCKGTCSRPNDVPNSYPSGGGDTFFVGKGYRFSCYSGYYMSGNPTRTCRSFDEGWTEARYSCRIKRCGYLRGVDNGRIVYTKGDNFGSTAKVICNEGYESTSDRQVKRCYVGESDASYGEWSGSLPSCRIITCDTPVEPTHGSIPYLDHLVPEYGNEITYQCDIGYKIKGQEVGRCNKDRSWGEVPTCVESADCQFTESTAPVCGYTANNWRRQRTAGSDGLAGYAAVSQYGRSTLQSITLPVGWAEDDVCLSFLYKLSRGRSLHVESVPNGARAFLTTHPNEVTSRWLNAAVTISASRGLTFQFRTEGSQVYLDDVAVEPKACENNCERTPCQNGGACFNRIDTYTCFCTNEFEGPHCEYDLKCQEPPQRIDHGYRLSLSPGILLPTATAEYKCHRGYKFEGKESHDDRKQIRCFRPERVTESRWSPNPSRFRCNEITCNSPPTAANRRLLNPKAKWLPGDIANYRCQPGYMTTMPPSATCGEEGHWSNDPPHCIRISCKTPAREANRRLLNPKEKWLPGDTANYRCLTGYIAWDEDAGTAMPMMASCGEDGHWSNDPPHCIRNADCQFSEPSAPFCGYTSTNWRRVRTIDSQGQIGYAAVSGYRRSTLRSVTIPDGWAEGDICLTFQYKLSLGSTLVVESAARYTTNFLTTHPNEVSSKWLNAAVTINAQRRLTFQFQTDRSQVHLDNVAVLPKACENNCDRIPCQNGGTCFNRINTSTCFCTNEFEGSHCEYDLRCQEPPKWIGHGYRMSLSPAILLPMATAEYKCHPGYKFKGEELHDARKQIQCIRLERSTESRWSANPSIFKCDEITCNSPPREANRRLLNPQEKWLSGDIASYRCQPGYTSIMPMMASCRADGHWSNDPPHCIQISCKTPANGESRRLLNQQAKWSPGTIAKYQCQPGHIAWDEDTGTRMPMMASCGEDGYWSNDPPICIPLKCQEPPQRIYRGYRVRVSRDILLPNATAEYKCVAGHKFEGEVSLDVTKEIRCIQLEQSRESRWNISPSSFRCEEISCKPPTSEANRRLLNPQSKWVAGDTAHYKCQTGYIAWNEDTHTAMPLKASCGEDGLWSNDPPRCIRTHCTYKGISGRSSPKVVNLLSKYPVGSEIYFKCPVGYTISAPSLRCVGTKKWSGDIPQCTSVSCRKPPRIPNGRYLSGEKNMYGDFIKVGCTKGYFRGETDRIKCLWNGTWSEHRICKAVRTGCPRNVRPPKNSYFDRGSDDKRKFIQCYALYKPFDTKKRPKIHCENGNVWYGKDSEHNYCTSERLPTASANIDGLEYLFYQNIGKATYKVAQRRCQSIGGNLPIIYSEELHNNITNQIVNKMEQPKQLFIGLRKIDNRYQWDPDNVRIDPALPTNYRAWYPGRSRNDDCVFLAKNGNKSGWLTVSCSFKLSSQLCQRAPSPCRPNPCKNGGRCNLEEGTASCNCSTKYTGERCETEIKCDFQALQERGFKRLTTRFYSVGEKVPLICDEGFQPGERETTCQLNGEWSYVGTCLEITCENPPLPARARNLDHRESYKVGDVIYIECVGDYELDGNGVMQCRRNGTWSALQGRCREITCGSPPLPRGGSIRKDAGPYEVGYVVNIGCTDEYELLGNGTIQCQRSRSWTELQAECREITCGRPPLPRGGRNQNDAESYKVGDVVNIGCTAKYELRGNGVLRCKRDRTWTEFQAECQEITCGRPQLPRGARIQNGPEPYKPGDVVNIGCTEGYELRGNGRMKCRRNRTWTELRAECRETTCRRSPLPHRARIQNGTEPYKVGDIVNIGCSAGYELHGNGVIQCKRDRTWTEFQAECQEITCARPKLPQAGRIMNHAEPYKVGDVVNIGCSAGYELRGSGAVQCKGDRTWTEFQAECQEITCGRPYLPRRGRIQNGAEPYKVGDIVNIGCTAQYELVGNGEVRCKSDRTWTEFQAECREIICGRPQLPRGGRIQNGAEPYKLGAVVNIGCTAEYELRGNGEVQCKRDRTWTDFNAECREIICGRPELPRGGRIQYGAEPYKVGDVVNIGCTAEYELIGNGQVQCKRDRTWTDFLAECREIICGRPQLPRGGRIQNGAEPYKVGDVVNIGCEAGYELRGYGEVQCKRDRTWTEFQAECREFYPCAAPYPPYHSYFDDDRETFPSGSSITIVCQTGYSLKGGEPTWSCNDAAWIKTDARCEADEPCQTPLLPKHSLIVGGIEEFPSGRSISLACRGGRKISGNGTWLCDNGGWIGANVTCVVQSCRLDSTLLAAYDLAIVGGHRNEDFPFGTEVSLTCLFSGTPRHFDDATISPRMTCGEDGRWSPSYFDFFCADETA